MTRKNTSAVHLDMNVLSSVLDKAIMHACLKPLKEFMCVVLTHPLAKQMCSTALDTQTPTHNITVFMQSCSQFSMSTCPHFLPF